MQEKGRSPSIKRATHLQRNQINSRIGKPKIDPNLYIRCGDTQHRPGFSYPATKYQCKNYKIGHFTSRCLTKTKAVNQVDRNYKIYQLNAWKPIETDDDSFYICEVHQDNKPKKRLYVNLPLTARHYHKKRTHLQVHIDPGANVNVMPVSVYKQLSGDVNLQHIGPVQCTMSVYTKNMITNLRSTCVHVKYPAKPPQQLLFNITELEGSILLCSEDVLSLDLIKPKDGLKDMVDGAILIASTMDTKHIHATESSDNKNITCKADIVQLYPEVLGGPGTFLGDPYHINMDPTVPPQ